MNPLRIVAHLIALTTVGGVVSQLVIAAAHEPRNLVWGVGVVLLTVTALVAGWLIALRRPENPLGWLIIAVPLLLGLQGYAVVLGTALVERAPTAAAWFDWYGGDNEWSWLPPIGILFTQIPLRFPTGRLPSPRWRWYSRFAIAAVVIASVVSMTFGRSVGDGVPNPTLVDWGDATVWLSDATFGLLVVATIGSLASMAVRYRHAGAVERTQLRWVFWAVSVVVGLLVIGLVLTAVVGGTETGTTGSRIAEVWMLATSVAYSLIPLAILFAVLRRGLYSIDRIISRTAAYTIVTALTLAIYAVALLIVSALLSGLPAIGVAVATLAAAAAFLPLLRSVRRGVDRRFDRAQYDAEQVVERFGERIRNGADPHIAGADLLGAVAQTLQPTAIGLWTREVRR